MQTINAVAQWCVSLQSSTALLPTPLPPPRRRPPRCHPPPPPPPHPLPHRVLDPVAAAPAVERKHGEKMDVFTPVNSAIPVDALDLSPRSMSRLPAPLAGNKKLKAASSSSRLSFGDVSAFLAGLASPRSAEDDASAYELSALTAGRFTEGRRCGQGAYATVLSARCARLGPVAVKRTRNIDGRHWQIMRRSIRELLILRRLRSDDNERGPVTTLISAFTAPRGEVGCCRDLYVVQELCAGNLQEVRLPQLGPLRTDFSNLTTFLANRCRRSLHAAALSL